MGLFIGLVLGLALGVTIGTYAKDDVIALVHKFKNK